MKKILMLHEGKAYLPERFAYMDYFNYKGDFCFYDCADLSEYAFYEFDMLWYFMGVYRSMPRRPMIHEYNSLSTGGWLARPKNLAKKILHPKPNARIFLNQAVRRGFGFQDGAPSAIRDMGVDSGFFIHSKKEYDFVYMGSITQSRGLPGLLDVFKNTLRHKTLLLIGHVDDEIHHAYGGVSNIVMAGRLKHTDVPEVASKAEYGINLIPDRYPFNIQASTKLLEYCAMGLKIATTNYRWVNEFETQRGGKFFRMNMKKGDYGLSEVEGYSTKTPEVEDLCWGHVIKKSGIEKLLKEANV